jgi:hypothetical protein
MKNWYLPFAVFLVTGCTSLTDRRALIDVHYYPSAQTNRIILSFFNGLNSGSLVDCKVEAPEKSNAPYIARVYRALTEKQPVIEIGQNPDTGYTTIPLTIPGFKAGVDRLDGKDFDGIYPIPFRRGPVVSTEQKNAALQKAKSAQVAGKAGAVKKAEPPQEINIFEGGGEFVAKAEPGLSKYQRRVGNILRSGSTLEIEVHYDLKRGNSADAAALKQYITEAFQKAKWVQGATSGIVTEKKGKYWRVNRALAFKKGESFKPDQKTYNPLCAVLWFTKSDGSVIDATYYFKLGKDYYDGR